MDKEITIRINTQPEILTHVIEHAVSSKNLDTLTGSFYKPKNVLLENYPPNREVVRIRTKPNGESKAEKIVVIQDNNSYQTKSELIYEGDLALCEQKLTELGFESWVKYEQSATEYSLELNGSRFKMLDENFDGQSTTLKFETVNTDAVWAFLKPFGVYPKDAINLNTAEILYQRQSKS